MWWIVVGVSITVAGKDVGPAAPATAGGEDADVCWLYSGLAGLRLPPMEGTRAACSAVGCTSGLCAPNTFGWWKSNSLSSCILSIPGPPSIHPLPSSAVEGLNGLLVLGGVLRGPPIVGTAAGLSVPETVGGVVDSPPLKDLDVGGEGMECARVMSGSPATAPLERDRRWLRE